MRSEIGSPMRISAVQNVILATGWKQESERSKKKEADFGEPLGSLGEPQGTLWGDLGRLGGDSGSLGGGFGEVLGGFGESEKAHSSWEPRRRVTNPSKVSSALTQKVHRVGCYFFPEQRL